MFKEILDGFEKIASKSNLHYFDGTFGRGGHYLALKSAFPNLITTAMDQDIDAINYGNERFRTEVQNETLRLIHDNFFNFSKYNINSFDMALLDLGVSSPQLDRADRGFSFYHEGPLDMRMNQQQGLTAEMVINTYSEDDLIKVFQDYGEIYKPFRVVRAIVHDRKTKAFKTTRELAGLIERVEGWRNKGFHPATLYFMALRLVVNGELEVLQKTLPKLMELLNEGGRLAVLTFHSLEDRIVKNIFRDSHLGKPVNKKVIVATQEECKSNPRSRSAKLRFFERISENETNN